LINFVLLSAQFSSSLLVINDPLVRRKPDYAELSSLTNTIDKHNLNSGFSKIIPVVNSGSLKLPNIISSVSTISASQTNSELLVISNNVTQAEPVGSFLLIEEFKPYFFEDDPEGQKLIRRGEQHVFKLFDAASIKENGESVQDSHISSDSEVIKANNKDNKNLNIVREPVVIKDKGEPQVIVIEATDYFEEDDNDKEIFIIREPIIIQDVDAEYESNSMEDENEDDDEDIKIEDEYDFPDADSYDSQDKNSRTEYTVIDIPSPYHHHHHHNHHHQHHSHYY